MLRSFCCTNTRVTLDTPMPPRMRTTETNEAEVVLRACEVLPHLVFAAAVRPDADKLVRERAAQRIGERVKRRRGNPQQELMRRAAAERQQAGVGQRGVVDDDARTEAEGTKTAPGLRPDHAANFEWDVADEDPIADLQIELRQQFGPHDDAVIAQQVVRVAFRWRASAFRRAGTRAARHGAPPCA